MITILNYFTYYLFGLESLINIIEYKKNYILNMEYNRPVDLIVTVNYEKAI